MDLHHVQLAIPPDSEDACREFYCGLIGWQEIEKPPALAQNGGLWLQVGSHEVHLGVEADFRPAKKAHPAFLTAEIRKLAKRLTEAGCEVQWDNRIQGQVRFFVFDAVGNRLEFMQASLPG